MCPWSCLLLFLARLSLQIYVLVPLVWFCLAKLYVLVLNSPVIVFYLLVVNKSYIIYRYMFMLPVTFTLGLYHDLPVFPCSNATFMVKPLECFTPLHLQVTVNVPGHLGMTVIFKQMTVFKGSMPPSIGHMELLVWMQRADFSEHIQGFKSPGDPLNLSHFDAPNTKSAPTGYRRAPNIISHHYKQQLSAKASIVPEAPPIRFR